MGRYIRPTGIICSENADKIEALFDNKPMQTNFTENDCAVIRRGGYILADFGKELCGGIMLSVQRVSEKRSHCRIVFGESVSEALSTIGEKNAVNDHSVRDSVVEITCMSTFRYGSTGFRFVKIEAYDCDILLKGICAVSDSRELEYKGSFECSDELLNRIWKTGAYTVALNTNEMIWDGIKRDRLVWIGDMYPEVSTILSVFGYDESIKKSLDFVKNETPPDKWMNGIATYSMWWIIIHYDLFMYTGDIKYLAAQADYMRLLVQNAAKWIAAGFPSQGLESFVDWNTVESPCRFDGVKSVLSLAFGKAACIFRLLKDGNTAGMCERYVQLLKDEKSQSKPSKGIAALNILAGRETAESSKIISGNSAEGLSCFMGFFVLLAKAETGEFSEALDIIRSYWGGMLEMGATTFWEDFDINWMKNAGRIDEIISKGKKDIHGDFGKHCYRQFRHSLCHGWASGPTAYLSQTVLGIKIAEAGCKRVIVNPQLGNLDWAKGSYPTPYGNICVEHIKKDGKTETRVSAPREVEISCTRLI